MKDSSNGENISPVAGGRGQNIIDRQDYLFKHTETKEQVTNIFIWLV